MEEGRFKFTKNDEQSYHVYTDIVSGKMVYVGRVSWRLFAAKGGALRKNWSCVTPCGNRYGPYATRKDAANKLI